MTAAVLDDLEHRLERGKRTQVRLKFATATNDDADADFAFLTTAGFTLVLTYLVD